MSFAEQFGVAGDAEERAKEAITLAAEAVQKLEDAVGALGSFFANPGPPDRIRNAIEELGGAKEQIDTARGHIEVAVEHLKQWPAEHLAS